MEFIMYKYVYDVKSVGKRVRKIRKEKRMTQEQLADKLFLSVDSISNIENGKQNCMPEHMMRICEIFHVSMDYFYFEDEKKMDDQYGDIINLLNGCDKEELMRVEQMIRLFLKK
jgi:transcriptional regulator with XRE-family HTH domain